MNIIIFLGEWKHHNAFRSIFDAQRSHTEQNKIRTKGKHSEQNIIHQTINEHKNDT